MPNIGESLNVHHDRLRYAPLPDAVMAHPELSSTAKIVYALLSRLTGRNENCWPSQEYIAERIGNPEIRTVQRVLKELADLGFIGIRRTGRNNIYTLTWNEYLLKHVPRQEVRSGDDIPSAPDTTKDAGPNNKAVSDVHEEQQPRAREEKPTPKPSTEESEVRIDRFIYEEAGGVGLKLPQFRAKEREHLLAVDSQELRANLRHLLGQDGLLQEGEPLREMILRESGYRRGGLGGGVPRGGGGFQQRAPAAPRYPQRQEKPDWRTQVLEELDEWVKRDD